MNKLNENSYAAWSLFLNNDDNKGHIQRHAINGDLENHIAACKKSADEMALRVRGDCPDYFDPKVILEVGSSAGINCFALQEIFPDSQVLGVEPEHVAVMAAKSLIQEGYNSPEFFEGFGENLPLDSGSVDLIVCHTVIEHVANVDLTIGEFARVLKQDGLVHLDAPNYLWPYEVHLKIFTIPMLGKRFVKWCAARQGKKSLVSFVDHLQFVNPFQLEGLFRRHGFIWNNRAYEKLVLAAKNSSQIKKYVFASKFMIALSKLGLSNLAAKCLARCGLYPSVMYTLRKR